jgi:hypothetical protein
VSILYSRLSVEVRGPFETEINWKQNLNLRERSVRNASYKMLVEEPERTYIIWA